MGGLDIAGGGAPNGEMLERAVPDRKKAEAIDPNVSTDVEKLVSEMGSAEKATVADQTAASTESAPTNAEWDLPNMFETKTPPPFSGATPPNVPQSGSLPTIGDDGESEGYANLG